MRSLLGRFHRPMSRGAMGDMLTMNNLGDGSTLSLDFTTGVLDPRLTFSRASTATFINSSGYVDHAGANLLLYSAYADTNWIGYGTYVKAYTTGITSPIGDTTAVRITFDAVGKGLYYNSASLGSPNVVGATYTMSAFIRATASTTNLAIRFGDSGVAIGGNIPITTTWTRYSFTYTNAVSSSSPAIQSASGTATGEFEMWGFQLNPGSTAQTYYPTTTAAYNAPRFDYSPTTIGEPRGLLIEGQATNLALRSFDFNTTVADGTQWISSGYTRSNVSTLLPDGTTGNACQISGSISASFRNNAVTVVASTVYTWSFYARNNGGSQARYRVWNASAGSSIVDYTLAGSNYVSQIGGANNTSSTWVRVSVTFTTPVGCTSIFVYPLSSDSGTVDALVWGAQLELGSGASSYIPTGASQVTRNADSCVMTGTNFSSWFAGATEGVLFAHYEKPRSQSGNAAHDYSAVASRYNTGEGFIIYAGNTNFYPTNILWPTGGAIFAGGIATAIPSVTKQAGKWFGGNDVTMYSNGVVGTTAAGTGTVTPAMLSFGANSTTGTEATRDWLNSCVRKVKFYPTALSDAAIQSLTTP